MKTSVSPNRRFVVFAQRDGTFAVARQDGTDAVTPFFSRRPDAEYRAAAENRYDENDAVRVGGYFEDETGFWMVEGIDEEGTVWLVGRDGRERVLDTRRLPPLQYL